MRLSRHYDVRSRPEADVPGRLSGVASAVSPERYSFGAFELQLDERRLLAEGALVALRPRAFDLLAAFVDRAGHLVTKDELLDRVWPGVVVEEAALHVQVSALRKVLGNEAIATVSGQGYRFALTVTRLEAPQAPPKHNLPSQLTSFIGREQEIAQLKDLLTTKRLVTLTGAGGAGKTRLAIEVADRLLDAFADGVWLVELAALSDPQLVPQAVAVVLGVKEQPGKSVTETVCGYLASRNLLLVLDNAEHLLGACAQFADQALRRSTRLTILVTSRESLGITGELTYRVPSLTVPAVNEAPTPETAVSYEGVRLFLDRGRLIRPTFAITAENAGAVASICTRLDGIPLAIELAAPRLRSMSVEELSQRLDERFALLTEGSRTALPRHRTLRSMIDWSYVLLTSVEQAMLRRLSVFAGGWTLASAEQVCAGGGVATKDVIDLLASLSDKNLIVIEEQGGATRHRMLETVRQYTQDRLRESGEEALWRDRHFASFLALAEEAFPQLKGRNQHTWLDRLAAEHDNVRAALTWSAATNPGDALRLAASLMRFWDIRGHLTEGREWYARLLDAVPSRPASRDRARALNAAAILTREQGDHATSQKLLEESLALCRELNEPRGMAAALSNLATGAMDQGRYADAEAMLQEALTLQRAIDDRWGLAITLSNLGELASLRGDHAAAVVLSEEALTAIRDTGDLRTACLMLHTQGRAECALGKLDAAETHWTEGLTISRDLGDRAGMADGLDGFAHLAMARESPGRAAQIWGAAERLREEIGVVLPSYDRVNYENALSATRAALGDDAFERAWREGRAMLLEDAVQYALSGDDTPQGH